MKDESFKSKGITGEPKLNPDGFNEPPPVSKALQNQSWETEASSTEALSSASPESLRKKLDLVRIEEEGTVLIDRVANSDRDSRSFRERSVIADSYEILEEVARGGMGVVYKARQLQLNRVVALKMILVGQLASEQDVRRFQIEAESAAALNHPGIVPIYEIGKYEGQHFFSMGFVEGGSLADLIRNGPLPPADAALLVKKIADAVAYAHQHGVIHRDLKPANILLDRTGEPKVTDFGLARRGQGESELTRTGAMMGTPSYMSPEQAEGKNERIGPSSDIYSLGGILYCALTGRPPFQASNAIDTILQVIGQEPAPVRLLNRQVPADLEAICLKCLSKEIEQRYRTAEELVSDLDRFLRGEAVQASNSNWSNRLVRIVSRSRDDEQLRGWSQVIGWFSLIVLLCELLVQLQGVDGALGVILGIRGLQAGCFIGVLLRYRRIWSGSVHPAVAQMISLWVAFFVACYLHVAIYMERRWLGFDLGKMDYYSSYPTFSLFSGFLFAALGRQYWGGCYVIGAIFFLLALFLPALHPWSPLLFGVSWSSVLAVISWRLHRMAFREEANSQITDRPGSP